MNKTDQEWYKLADIYRSNRSEVAKRRDEIISKKRAAIIASNNIGFFYEQCDTAKVLMDDVRGSIINQVEKAINKYKADIQNYSEFIGENLTQLEGAQEKLRDIANMYQQIAQNLIHNYDEDIDRIRICESCAQQATGNSYFDEKNNKWVKGTCEGSWRGTIVSEYKDVNVVMYQI